MTTWVPVLVRLEDYAEVTRFVDSREATRAGSRSSLPALEVHADSRDGGASRDDDERLARRASWTREDLAKLAVGSTLTAQRWTRAMDVCTQAREQGEVWIPTSEVARRGNMDITQWRDAPRKISRHLKAHFPNVPRDSHGNAWWPLCAGGDDIPANGGEVWWAITADMAKRWLQVRGETLG